MTSTRRQVLKLGVVDFGIEETTLPNGVKAEFAVIRHPGASAVVALDDGGKVTMLRQYRYAVGRYLWEIPAGVRRTGEHAIKCAQRELAEEAGLSARRWDEIGSIVTVPSFCDEQIRLFLARELEAATATRDRDEIIEVERFSFNETLRMVRRGEIIDAKTIAALYLARHFIEVTGAGAPDR